MGPIAAQGLTILTLAMAVSAHSVQPVSVTELTSQGTAHRFEVQNDSKERVAYAHWFGGSPAPVPYCKNASGTIRICARSVLILPDGEPYIHERYIQPGQRVVFDAFPGTDEIVGIKLWISGSEHYVWVEKR
jgi:hypothetical protein